MGFNPPVPQRDSDWEIRVAVLLSLLLQVLLIFLGPTRRRSSAPLPRIAVWSCYLLADWVADLALGLLLNNMGSIGGSGDGGGSPAIFAFWMPFLLLHLGGPDTITAFSVEDNELWNRHLIGLLFELFSAAVIFFCSLRSNPLIPATVLILVGGVVKYGERTYSLYSASFESLRDTILGPPEPGANYGKLMMEFGSKKKAGLPVEIAIDSAEKLDIMAMRRELYAGILELKSSEVQAYEFFVNFRVLFVDLILSSKQRRLSQAFFLEEERLKPSEAFEIMDLELSFMYDMVYTKAPVAHSRAGWVLRSVCSGCLVAALVIFLRHDKGGMKPADVGITYALLLGGLALDAVALLMLLFSDRMRVVLDGSQRLRWLARLIVPVRRWRRRRRPLSGTTTSQLNLIRYCLEKPEHYSEKFKGGKWWLMVARMLGIEDVVDDLVFIRHVKLELVDDDEPRLFEFIFDYLKLAALEFQWKQKEVLMEFSNSRGMRFLKRALPLRRNEDDDGKSRLITIVTSSVEERDFDESLLLWHIATDLLSRFRGLKHGPRTKDAARMQAVGEALSEYMLYLLVKQPDMVSATGGVGLRPYRDTCAEARRFFGSMAGWIGSHEDARELLLSVSTSETKPRAVKGDQSKSVLFDACVLAKALWELDGGGDLMWEVVAGVWREMLTYAAGKCEGSTHVRKLNRGGELLTLVWLLMQHMGLSDMYEIQEDDPSAKLIVHY